MQVSSDGTWVCLYLPIQSRVVIGRKPCGARDSALTNCAALFAFLVWLLRKDATVLVWLRSNRDVRPRVSSVMNVMAVRME